MKNQSVLGCALALVLSCGLATSVAVGQTWENATAFPQSSLKFELGSAANAAPTLKDGTLNIIAPGTGLSNAAASSLKDYFYAPAAGANVSATVELRPHHAFDTTDNWQSTSLNPTITHNQADGYDVVVTLTNNQSTPQDVGYLGLRGIRFGVTDHGPTGVMIRKFNNYSTGGTLTHFRASTNSSFAYDFLGDWPVTLGSYAPVAVMHTAVGTTLQGGEGGNPEAFAPGSYTVGTSANDYTLGVGLNYDVLSYKHVARIETFHYADGYMVRYELNPGNDPSYAQGKLAPGEVRVYTLSARLLKGNPYGTVTQLDNNATVIQRQRWLHLLAPYRNFMNYTHNLDRDLSVDENGISRYKPILASELAFTHLQCQTSNLPNPYGWANFTNYTLANECTGGSSTTIGTYPFDNARVDSIGSPSSDPNDPAHKPGGWGQLARQLQAFHEQRGWRRFMVWATSGMRPLATLASCGVICNEQDSYEEPLGCGYQYPSDIAIAYNTNGSYKSIDSTNLLSRGMGLYVDEFRTWAQSTTSPTSSIRKFDVGIWWGYSSRIFGNSANPTSNSGKWYGPNGTNICSFTHFNINNSDHMAWSNNTVSQVLSTLGATSIGLDTYLQGGTSCSGLGTGNHPAWDAYIRFHGHLSSNNMLQFMLEPTSTDMLHSTRSAMYLSSDGSGGTDSIYKQALRINPTPHYLGDFLNWSSPVVVSYKQGAFGSYSGTPGVNYATAVATRDAAIRAARVGLVPIIHPWAQEAGVFATSEMAGVCNPIPDARQTHSYTLPTELLQSNGAPQTPHGIEIWPQPPASVNVTPTGTLTLRVRAFGLTLPTWAGGEATTANAFNYIWQHSPDGSENTYVTVGSNSSELVINNMMPIINEGYYRVWVVPIGTGSGGSRISRVTNVTVN
jgi:hypothetical protein